MRNKDALAWIPKVLIGRKGMCTSAQWNLCQSKRLWGYTELSHSGKEICLYSSSWSSPERFFIINQAGLEEVLLTG